MSLSHATDPASAQHAIDPDIVRETADKYNAPVTEQKLTESLNLFQALLVTERDAQSFFTGLTRPEQLDQLTETHARALITPVTWWELQANIDWGNTLDRAVLEAHREQFLAEVETQQTEYTSQQLHTLHPIVAQIPAEP